MEQAEIEVLVGELETRIDRLRSLYDQYFMGIERLEPLVPRKDVERRMQVLRKEQIRNTGLRFKFNVIIQRFNTYQTYWLRIARQIEQGTYRRDVIRATARFGVDPTKERSSAATAEERGAGARTAGSAREVSPPTEELEDGSAFLEPLDVDVDFDVDVDLEDGSFGEEAPTASLPKPRERFASAVRLELHELADPFEEHDPFPIPAPVSAPAPIPIPVPPPAPSAPSIAPKLRIAPLPGRPSAPPKEEDPRETEQRIAAPPRIATRSVSPPAQGSAAPPGLARGGEPRVIITKRGSVPDDLERLPSIPSPASPLRPGASASPASVSARPAVPPAPSSGPSLQRPATQSGAVPPVVRTPPSPASGAAAPPRPGAVSAPVPRPAGAPSIAASRAPPEPKAAAPATTVHGPSAAATKPVVTAAATPNVAMPAAAVSRSPAAPAAAPQPAAPVAPAGRVGDLSGDRFGQIYSAYVETRRDRNEPTHAITREALAKQLSESTERLKQKHGGKPIDFEVVVKDGKTILRPVVK